MSGRRNWLLYAILLISAALRVAAAGYFGDEITRLPGTADQISYHNLALRVLEGHSFSFDRDWWPLVSAGEPTAHWSYLYTFYLVGVYALFGPHPLAARLIQAIIVGILHPFLTYRIARHMFDERVGLVSASLAAVYAYFVYYPATLMTESFYIIAILTSLYLAIRMVRGSSLSPESPSNLRSLRQAILLGLAMGAAVLLRQVFLLVVPFLLLWIVWASRRRQLGSVVVAGAIIAVLILPFTAYNYSRFGRFVLLNTNSGFAFFWANHPVYGTQFEPILPSETAKYQELIPADLRGLDEASLDQALLARGMRFVLEDPLRYALLSLSRIPAYFMFWPSSDSKLISNVSRLASFGLFFPFMIYGLLRAFSDRTPAPQNRNQPEIVLLALFAGIYTAIHLLSWALIRYRLPVDAALLVFAGFGLAALGNGFISVFRLAKVSA